MALYLKNEKIAGFGGMPVIIEGIDTTDATAKASDILKGKTAYVNDVKITGTSTFDADTKDATATAEDILTGKTAYVSGQKLVGVAQDNKAPYAWEKYEIVSETVQTLPPTSIDAQWWTGSVTVSEFCWQKGDTVAVSLSTSGNSTSPTIYTVENAPEPTETLSFGDNGETLVHSVSGDTITLTYNCLAGAVYIVEINVIRSGKILVEYVVDDSEFTYPDNGIHTDGYWYKRVDNTGLYAWGKYELTTENVETFPSTTVEVTGMAAPKAQFPVSNYAWQAGDTVTFIINSVVFTVENIGEPTDSIELTNEVITEPYYICHTEDDGLYIQLELNGNDQSLESATLAINVERTVKDDFIEYIVDDFGNAYPNGAIHTDGYWYEKIIEELIINNAIEQYNNDILNKAY